MVFKEEERNLVFETEKWKYFEDESNDSSDYLRNRIRQNVIPLLKEEGLNPNKIYENFHSREELFVDKKSPLKKEKIPSYLKIDSSSLENINLGILKNLLDLHAEILKLHPFSKKILLEVKKELDKNASFQIQNKELILWKNPTSDLFIVPKNSPVLQKPKLLERDNTLFLTWNNQEKKILSHYEIGFWQEGLKILKNGLHKEVSELFRGLQIPMPIRPLLPILFKNKEPAAILFSLWNNKTKDFLSDFF